MILDNLPGLNAQLKMAPLARAVQMLQESTIPQKAVSSSVLVLLYPDHISAKRLIEGHAVQINEKWEVLLMERSNYKGKHSGQISFPGGKEEPGDSGHEATAAREALEEVGISPHSYLIVGELTHLYIKFSNFVIYPVLAISKTGENPSNINPAEVAGWQRVPLGSLAPEKVSRMRVFRNPLVWFKAPVYNYNNYKVWGATAMILSELYQFMLPAKVLISFNKPYISSSNVEI